MNESLFLDDFKEISKTFLNFFYFISIISTMNFQLLWCQFLSPIFFVNHAYCCHFTFKMIFFCIAKSIFATSLYISLRKVYQMMKTSPQQSQPYFFVYLLQVFENSFAFVNYLKSGMILKLLKECSLIIDLSKLEVSTFFRPLAEC